MVRLGLALSLRSGREALIRLVLMASAVTVGVAVLLSVLADLHAFQATNNRPCWECTHGAAPARPTPGAPNSELWNYSLDYYQGHPIERLDVAALGPQAPVVPGVPRLPGAGQYYASPALATLLASVPRDELGDRFPGVQAGVVGDAALSSPDELAIIIGYAPERLAAIPSTMQVSAIATKPVVASTTSLYQYGFGLAAIALIFPLLILIGTATRLAAARREERFAALRLVGATARQINVIASMDALVGAMFGTLAGIWIFQLLRPAVADVAITGARYFPDVVTATGSEYAAVLIGVPLAAVGAALWSLRRVRISPLGVSRKTTPTDPRAWRVLPLLIGMLLFIGPATLGNNNGAQTAGRQPPHDLSVTFLGLMMIMAGLVVGGSWLTMQAARLVARSARGAATLLAARRLADNPTAAFRSVSGLVLAVFIGTAIAGLIPAIISGQQAVGGGTLRTVLRASFAPIPTTCAGDCGTAPIPSEFSLASAQQGLSPQTGAALLHRLRSYPGVTALALYTPTAHDSQPQTSSDTGWPPGIGHLVSCENLIQFAALGQCTPGVQAVNADFGLLLGTDNMLAAEKDLPIVDHASAAVADDLAGLALGAVLIKTDDPATLEKVRTLLTIYIAQSTATDAPKTFGEVAHTRAVLFDEIEQITLVVVAITLFVAGCSLAVAVGGSLLERKRPFTLLRLTGTPTSTLYRVVLLESTLPLVVAAAVAAAAGLAVAVPIVSQLAIKGGSAALPGHIYYLTISGGLAVSLAVILTVLPLLTRITEPNNARVE